VRGRDEGESKAKEDGVGKTYGEEEDRRETWSEER
jgi:hypothetical protein